MANVLLRNVPEETHREFKRRAKKNGRSVNAEMVAALGTLAEAEAKTGLLAQLEAIKRKYQLDVDEFTFEVERDRSPARYVDFSGPEFDWADKQ